MMAKAILTAVLLLAVFCRAEVTSFSVLPSVADPAVKTFDFPNWFYINREIVVDHKEDLPADRHQLLLWLPGTNGKGHDAQGFSNLAADLGYHVITLMYPDDLAAVVCTNDSDPKSFENFRMALIEGGHSTYQNGRKELSIDRTESMENRLIKLLHHLQEKRPKENWNQFLNDERTIKWETIAVAGQSQGGGHAALLGIKHKVARVICFGAPKDYSKRLNAPAAWYSDPSATPKDRFFAFNHHQDPICCTPQQLLENLKALGLSAFGPPAEVDTEESPYRHSHILYTSYPKVTIGDENSDGAHTAHTSGISSKNAERWKPIWTYMLTEKAD
jgi:hypothetical protein